VFLVGIVFGIAMDYQVFLVSRMREEYDDGAPPHDAIVNGFSHVARVVTAAAIIMISVFADSSLARTPWSRRSASDSPLRSSSTRSHTHDVIIPRFSVCSEREPGGCPLARTGASRRASKAMSTNARAPRG